MIDATQDPFYQRLFRVFCWFSEGELTLPPARAAFLIEETHRLSGHPSTSRRLAFNGEKVSFRELLGLLENQFTSRTDLESAAQAVFERYLEQVLLKGFTLYRRNRVRSCRPWKKADRWLNGCYQITPGCLQIFHLKEDQLNQKLKMPIDGSTKIQTNRSENEKTIFVISNGANFVELASYDVFNTNHLENAIKIATSYPTRETLIIADRRNAARFHAEKNKETKEISGREAEIEAAEKLRLEREKAKLERDLEDERRALRDEEIVRGLATRMLEEERLKSEQIEKVLIELQQKFHEREQRQRGTDPFVDDAVEIVETSLEKSVDYEDALDVEDETYFQSQEEEVWQKEDYLILSTQSI